jgi:hypothetical protein
MKRLLIVLVLLLGLLPGTAAPAGVYFSSDFTIEGAINACAATGGATNTYACNVNPAISTYLIRSCYTFTADAANTAAATLNLNSVGPLSIKKRVGGVLQDLVAGDIGTGQVTDVCYDGTFMQCQNCGSTSIAPIVTTLNAANGTPTAVNVGVAGARIIAERFDINGALTIAVPTGTPKNGQSILFRLKPATTQQTVAFTTGAGGFCAVAGQVMPTTTSNSTTYAEYGFTFNSSITPSPGCWVFDGGTPATAPLDRAYGGTGQALTDPGAHSILVWDDTLNQIRQALLSGITYNSGTNTVTAAGGGSGTGTIQLWPGMLTLPDGTSGNLVVPAQVFLSTGTPPTDAPKMQFTDLVFDNVTTDQMAFSCFPMPNDYNAAQPTTMYINWRRTTGTTAQNAEWKAAVAAVTPGGTENIMTKILNTVTYSGASAAGTTTNALRQSTITLTMDSAAGRDTVCVMFGRNADDATDDNLADPAAVSSVWLEYTKQ